jgi:hypothetical protein
MERDMECRRYPVGGPVFIPKPGLNIAGQQQIQVEIKWPPVVHEPNFCCGEHPAIQAHIEIQVEEIRNQIRSTWRS